MRPHRGPDVFFKFLISLGEFVIHLNRKYALIVSWQVIRNVFEGKERRCVHQELAEQERRRTRLLQNLDRLLRRP